MRQKGARGEGGGHLRSLWRAAGAAGCRRGIERIKEKPPLRGRGRSGRRRAEPLPKSVFHRSPPLSSPEAGNPCRHMNGRLKALNVFPKLIKYHFGPLILRGLGVPNIIRTS